MSFIDQRTQGTGEHGMADEDPWATVEDPWSGDEAEPEDAHYVLRYDPEDARDATFRPGVGPYIECSALSMDVYGARLTPDGPTAISLPTPEPAWTRNPPGNLTIPKDALAANIVNWMVHHRVPQPAQRLGVTLRRGIVASSWFNPRRGSEDKMESRI